MQITPCTRRTLIVGDVHGCIRELENLVKQLGRETGDDWIFSGDLCNKGESSAEVVDYVSSMGARSVIGNHEVRLLRKRGTDCDSCMNADDLATMREFEERHWTYLEMMEPWIDLRELGMVVVHGGFLPGRAWRDQELELVTTIQVIDESGQGRMRKACPSGRPWADLWQGPEFIAYGHTPRREVFWSEHAVGLDTGCVHGGMLSALVLPERRIVQVPARRVYCRADF